MLLLFPVSLLAQGVVYGVVTSPNGSPIEYVTVGLLNSTKAIGTSTDEQGRYSLRLHQKDSVTIRFSATGYEAQERKIVVVSGINTELNVVLRPHATQLQEVTISEDASRSTAYTNIDVRKLDDAVGPQGGVESLLKTLPDVSSNNELSSQYSVRGGSFDENLVYINGIEVYRPMLVRSGQQEGMSIINPDLVDHILFSPGGFDATAGDKMASVLDITYARPTSFAATVSASLLGASASVKGTLFDRFNYSIGFRQHNNRYIFSTLDTKGSYNTSYTDLQAVVNYKLSDKFDLSFLVLWSRNRYGLIPESQTTTFGSFMESLELDVYFDGEESDGYNTAIGALTLSWRPNDHTQIQWINSLQSSNEEENYDIQSQYWLYELGMTADAEVEKFDRGVGTFLEHARNSLRTLLPSSELRGVHHIHLGSWQWGVKFQMDKIKDRLREWKWVDSAGYAMPAMHPAWGTITDMPAAPVLQQFAKAHNEVTTLHLPSFIQRNISWETNSQTEIDIAAGVRAHYYSMSLNNIENNIQEEKQHFFISPRVSLSIKPHWKQDMLFRTAVGVYQQPPFYREMRLFDGSLNPNLKVQTSYQAMQSFDWKMRLFNKPFQLTADLFYKYLTNLIPYTIDNLRLRYDASQTAVGYATGVSLRLYGEFVDGLESWASISYMHTQEDIEGDNLSWIARPTDQRFSFKVFFQDYVPTFPWWRMSINFIYGTGTPVTFPSQKDRSVERRLPSYFRVDWGNTVQLSRIEGAKSWKIFHYIDDILIGLEVFNLFNYRNVVSYIWISDYTNVYYPVPNYLTARQINLKATISF
ncbi:MAG: TonB-dependent receptor [Bacteroidales bacterium]|nr:TonB-dependent receptor [Bacteroidales bacterium]